MVRLDPRLPSSAFAGADRRHLPPFRSRAGHGVLPPGTVLDKYRIDALLGTGGFGAVYRATHLLLETVVAIKHLRADVLARDPALVARLLDEARWAARIDHPSVVRVLDVTQSPSLTYVVMEYIEGETLASALDRKRRLPVDALLPIAIDVAEGLAAGLACKLVHRDVKPANIVLASNGRARIVDFGLALATGEADTTSRARVGTHGYASPEQQAGGAIDFRSDIYALGVTLDRALRGRGNDARTTFDDPRSRALVRLLHRMLAPEPDDRPASYEALLVELRAIAARRAHDDHEARE